MANHKTGAQRFNDMKDKIFAEAKVNSKKYGTEHSSTWGKPDHRSEFMKKSQAKSKALHSKKTQKLLNKISAPHDASHKDYMK